MHRIRCATAGLLFLLATSPVGAQAPDTGRVPEPLFTDRDALYAGGFVAGAALLAPLDHALNDALQEPAYQGRRALRGAAAGFRVLGFPGAPLLTASLYAGGRLANRPGLADAGLHTTEAISMAIAVTVAGKYVVGRARPHISPDDAASVAFARGFEGDDYQSFPSGHTATAFAAASAATRELGQWAPRYRVPAGVALYSGATLVGFSRMYNQQHWASDVVIGAAIGTFSGWKVVSYNHAHPTTRLNRLLLGTVALPMQDGGILLVWSLPR